jgi:hypothetical protein
LKYLSQAGAASVTYFETTGPRGVGAARKVLRDFSASGGVVPVDSSDPLSVVGVILRGASPADPGATLNWVNLTGCGWEFGPPPGAAAPGVPNPGRIRMRPYCHYRMDWPEPLP